MTVEELETRVVHIEQTLGKFAILLDQLADRSRQTGETTTNMANQLNDVIIEMRAYLQKNDR